MFSARRLYCSAKAAANRGFALIIVIWGIGLLALIATVFTTTARMNVLATANIVDNAKAEALADAAVNIAILDLMNNLYTSDELATTRFKIDGTPYVCRLTAGAVARVVVVDEGGKVDLNGAPPQLLTRLFTGFGTSADNGRKLAAAVLDFRDVDNTERSGGAEAASYRIARKPYGPKNAKFDTISELQQVLGMTHELFRAVEPFITVHSARTGIDPAVMPLELAAVLSQGRSIAQTAARAASPGRSGIPPIPARFVARSKQTAFSITAEVATESGGIFIRKAVFQLISSVSGAHRFKTWTRGSAPGLGRPSSYGNTLPQC